ncbi:MAG: hypothetical protein MK213_05610, partial [Planctomycetes bacterium]|nr:hypothetical protein [Planctomycetota bacterium]
MNSTLQRERDLFQNRPRSRFLRFSGALLTLAVAATWMSGEVALGEVFSERRAENLQRFLSEELTIASIATGEHTFASWCLDLWNSKGGEAVGTTFWLSVLAMLLAGVFGWLTAPLGASNLMTREPMHGPSRGSSLNPWSLCAQATRLLQVLLRAIPEYVWAFFLLAVLGPGAWPAILALAIHNAGILGRLGSDTFENLSPRPLQSLFQLGASRSQVAVSAGAAGT